MTANSAESQPNKTGWLPWLSLILFCGGTTLLDLEFLATKIAYVVAVFSSVVVFLQGYFLWYFFYKFRPGKALVASDSPGTLGAYSRLFAIATFGCCLVAVVGAYALHCLRGPR
jgi:hypothetical protein